MTKKAAANAAPKKEDPKALRVEQQFTETPADALAHSSLRPTVQAALTLLNYNKDFGEMSINTLVGDLSKQCELANNSDLSRAEAMLMAQAHTLDSIFNSLARRAALNMGEYINAAETYLRLALKAQTQCRATLETLAYIKNPPTAFIRQQNVAVNQQVNNRDHSDPIPTGAPAPARVEISKSGNELLSEDNHAALDSNRASTTGGINSQLETVGAIHRLDHAER